MTSTHALPKGRFTAVLADPPWNFRTRSAKGRNRCPDGQRHYKVMSLAKALPAGALTAPDSALFLWVVDCKIPEGLAVGSAWGFTYKTVAFTWVKTTKVGRLSHVARLLDPRESRVVLAVHQGLAHAQIRIAPRGRHSAKPAETCERIEAMVSGPYIELFARARRPGWEAWGNQLDEFPTLPTPNAAGHVVSRIVT